MVEKGECVEIAIESLAYGGKAVGRHNGLVVFVEGAAPGDRVSARIVRRKADYAEAVVAELIEPSP
ncbi:TRAM domain-containing protein, partial [Candidatus Sumerlaeota bacterium]|nr:TRAM domain-containing protein [Candidatus Sumerlaeota bacterium]